VRAHVTPRLRAWKGALRQAAHRGTLRRAQISFAAVWAGESAFMVALGVLAFRSGGVVAVGVVTAARMAPAALSGLTSQHQAHESARRRAEDLPAEPDATARPDHLLTEIQAQAPGSPAAL
jgi:hypothetical protein